MLDTNFSDFRKIELKQLFEAIKVIILWSLFDSVGVAMARAVSVAPPSEWWRNKSYLQPSHPCLVCLASDLNSAQ